MHWSKDINYFANTKLIVYRMQQRGRGIPMLTPTFHEFYIPRTPMARTGLNFAMKLP